MLIRQPRAHLRDLAVGLQDLLTKDHRRSCFLYAGFCWAPVEVASGNDKAGPTGPVVGTRAGAEAVQAPAPDAVQSQIPERELTVEEFLEDSGRPHSCG